MADKVFILVDTNNVVRCMATEKCNLHKDKLHMNMFCVERKDGIVGDIYMAESDSWTKAPENHAGPTQEEIYITKIAKEVRTIAIESLKAKGELPIDYKE